MSVKSVIVNTIRGKRHHSTLPCSGINALAFADAFVSGETSVYENGVGRISNSDSDTCIEAVVNCENTLDGLKTSFKILLKNDVDENQLISALLGKNINGVLVDFVSISSFRIISI